MDDSFKLPVTYKGEEIEFEAKLVTYGYSHQFQVDIYGVTVLFEPDEERNYRAILDNEGLDKGMKPDVDLIRVVGKKIEELFAT